MKIGPLDAGGRPPKPEREYNREPEEQLNQIRSDKPEDSIEISHDGQSLSDSARLSAESLVGGKTTPDDDSLEIQDNKTEQIRQKIESGYYDSPKIRQEIARRLTDEFLG